MFHTCVVRTCPVGKYGVRPEDRNPTAIHYHNISSSPQAWTPKALKEGDAEEEVRKKVHGEGYEVPSVTIRMETVDSDQDFEETLPPSQVYVDFLSMLIAKYAMILMRLSRRKKERNGWTEYLIETKGARTRKENTTGGVARGRRHHSRLFVAR